MTLRERLAATAVMTALVFLTGYAMLAVGILTRTTMVDIVSGSFMFALGWFLALRYAMDRTQEGK